MKKKTKKKKRPFEMVMTIREAAAILNCNHSHATRLAKRGILEGRSTAGGGWIVDSSSVEDYKENRPRPGRKPAS